MSPSTAFTAVRKESTLACVNCARCKAKCDRKLPCTRCVEKKLVCRTRIPQRGSGQAILTRRSSHTGEESTVAVISGQPEHTQSSTSPMMSLDMDDVRLTAGSGIWMDWSHSTSQLADLSWDSTNLELILNGMQNAEATGSIAPEAGKATLGPSFPRVDGKDADEEYAFAPISNWSRSVTNEGNDQSLFGWDPSLNLPLESNISSASGRGSTQRSASLTSCSPTMPVARATASDHVPLPDFEGWSLYQCNPVVAPSDCGPTAALHIQDMAMLLRDAKAWPEKYHQGSPVFNIEALLPDTRERVTAVLQILFNKAQQFYGLQNSEVGPIDWARVSSLVLPPQSTLDHLCRAYFHRSDPYYPYVTTTFRDVNSSMETDNALFPAMMLLLTLAAGAMNSGVSEPHGKIANGLLEICRTALRNLMDQNIKASCNPDVLQCAMLLVFTAAWSGDKWQMDLAQHQRAIFLEVLLRGQIHENKRGQLARLEACTSLLQRWETWKELETANRISYTWLILDHEVCLFQDIPATSFHSVSALGIPVPSGDPEWSASSMEQWMRMHESSFGEHRVPILARTLTEWISWFAEINDTRTASDISPVILRLLLCHIQNQVIQLRFSIDTRPNGRDRQRGARNALTIPHLVQMQDAEECLDVWSELAKVCTEAQQASHSMAANMAMYHLTVLNTMVSFLTIERIAREGPLSVPKEWKRARHLEMPREILMHCSQILHHLRRIPAYARPCWHAAAVYRVALISWTASMSCGDGKERGHLDDESADRSSVATYLSHDGPTTVLPEGRGGHAPLDPPSRMLRHCIRFLDVTDKTRFMFGIQRKLAILLQRWHGDS